MGVASTAVNVGITANNIASAPGSVIDWAFNPIVDWVAKPLFALAEPVIGNEDVLNRASESWTLLAQGMDEARDEAKRNAAAMAPYWSGAAASAAQSRLAQQADMYHQAGEAARGVASVLQSGAAFVSMTKDILKSIITEFLEWAAFTIIVALANSFWTLGASDAAGVAAVEGEAVVTTGRVMQVINKIREALTRISRSLHQLIERYRTLRTLAKALQKVNKIHKDLKTFSKDGSNPLVLRALAWKGAKLTNLKSRIGKTLGVGTSGISTTKQAVSSAVSTAEQDAAQELARRIDELIDR